VPAPFVGIRCEVLDHVLVNFLLQVDPDGSVSADDFVRADSSVGGDVAAGIGDANVSAVIANRMVRALDGCGCKPVEKVALRRREVLRADKRNYGSENAKKRRQTGTRSRKRSRRIDHVPCDVLLRDGFYGVPDFEVGA